MLNPNTVKIEKAPSQPSTVRGPHINVPSDYIHATIGKIPSLKEDKSHPFSGVEKRPYKPALAEQGKAPKAEVAQVTPKKLKFHPEIPKETEASVKQCAGNLTTLLTLFPQGKALISQAIQEQRILGAPV
jgi:hypothetical protein